MLLGLAIGPAPVHAWGSDAHRISGDIAWRELEPVARERVGALLPGGRYSSLAEATLWADTYAKERSHYDWLRPLHVIPVPADAEAVVLSRDCPEGACVVAAIQRFDAELRDPERSHVERALALKLLAHFVGDLHQPLHVAHPDGKFGGRTRPLFFGSRRSIHGIWDHRVLKRAFAARDWSDPTRDPWRLYAAELRAAIDDEARERWIAELDPLRWAEESLALSRRYAYAIDDDAVLGDAFVAQTLPVIAERLQQAGVRLGALLNRAFASEP